MFKEVHNILSLTAIYSQPTTGFAQFKKVNFLETQNSSHTRGFKRAGKEKQTPMLTNNKQLDVTV